MRLSVFSALMLTLALGGCLTTAETSPDYRIKVMFAPDGKPIAVPPECLDWRIHETGSPWTNTSSPTYGCASARNLAAQVANPEDLIEGKPLGAPDPVVSSAAVARYKAGKTTPLIDPNASKPGTVIKMEDSRVGGGDKK